MNRQRQARWDANHLTTIATKLPAMEAEGLDRMIADAGYQSRYAFLLDLVETWQHNYTVAELKRQGRDPNAPHYLKEQAQRANHSTICGNFDII